MPNVKRPCNTHATDLSRMGTDTTSISCMGVGWVLTVRFDTQASNKIKYKFTIDIAQYPLLRYHWGTGIPISLQILTTSVFKRRCSVGSFRD